MSDHVKVGARGVQAQRAERASELRVLVILSALMSFASLSTDMYLPAFPAMQHALGGATGDIELTLSSFLAGFAAGQLLWGPVGDRYGRRLPVALGLVLFIGGSIGCALSTTVVQLITWRVVEALGACAGPVLARAMARDLYAGERAAQMLSTLILLMMAAPLLGPILGGQVLAFSSWRGIFWMLAAVGVLALAGLVLLPETLPPAKREHAPLRAVARDYLSLMRRPKLMGFALASAFFYAGMYVFIAASPFVYIDFYGVPASRYGLLFGANVVGMVATNFLNTRLVVRMGSERLFLMGTVVIAITGVALFVNTTTGAFGLFGVVVPMFCFAAMNGLVVANSVAGALSEATNRLGAASSLVGAMQYGSGVASAALVGWLSDGTPRSMGALVCAAGVAALITGRLVKR
ncbi:multidrug effflux MFS transporter [Myxococcus sp. K15C18031901]|uniref:multidrug effflux MFS transporter n=1 Tax=Myxococcus dinghuensis TaxID=2906761 RepID=UPI0020A79D0E|nr:multidrug effflux MFS transporter [Myxococcus dinghuensis]MCP3098420.1 multidrug effflux MFS transporter [Myxococcus dinghuensis]